MKLVFLVILVVLVVYMIFYMISYKVMMNLESSTSYECGFNLMNNTRVYFSYRFFLISILFLVFDVEIVLMMCFPYLMMNSEMFLISIMFLLMLILGLIYEYYWGSLEWVIVSKA